MDYSTVVYLVSRIVDTIGVSAIVLGIIFSLVEFSTSLFHVNRHSPYALLRQRMGRTIIVGLEVLIAADIIRSIAVPPTFANVGILAMIVLIRAFLSIQIENGDNWHFPWQKVEK